MPPFPQRYNDAFRGWPVAPQHQQHPVRGTFLDPRPDPQVPILWDRWRLANPFAPRLVLSELLAALDPATEIMIDLKGRDPRLPRSVTDALDAAGLRRLTVCSRSWPLLEHFRSEERVRIVHSVGSRRQLRMLLRDFGACSLQGVSIHARLLDAGVVTELRRRAEIVLSWPVNPLARELASWGVAGLISDRYELALELAPVPADLGAPA